MHERLKKRDQVRRITSELIQTFGSHQPKLEQLRATPLPDKTSVVKIVDDLLEVIYPGYFGWKSVPKSNLERHIGDLMDSVYTRLTQEVYRSIRPACEMSTEVCDHCVQQAEDESLGFLGKLAHLRRRLTDDVQAAFDGDPAAKSIDEVIVAYPGVFAITVYRLAHELQVQGIPLLPRIMTEYAHSVTGIDIHPGAVIGSGFFIDHGTGVVIGETTTIGNRVKLYQGVTLGALSFPKDEDGRMIRGKKRHPTIEDDVVIYAGATILGGTTVIGRGSVIGGNVWLTRSVPPNSRIVISGTEI